ncbi:hypothetical protein ACQKE0_08215 [Shewanella colwelliana]
MSNLVKYKTKQFSQVLMVIAKQQIPCFFGGVFNLFHWQDSMSKRN